MSQEIPGIMNTAEHTIENWPKASGRSSSGSLIDRMVAFVLRSLLALTALAFGTVEPWSIALFGIVVIILFTIWSIRLALFSTRRPAFPSILLPLFLLILYAIVQTIPRIDAEGRRWTISMDPEATWMAIEVAGILLIATLMVANVVETSTELFRFVRFVIFFGLVYSVFSLINHFTWNNKFFWLIEPSTIPAFPFGSFVNRNHFAGYIEMIAPIPLAMVLLRAVRGELSLIFCFASALMSFSVIASLSRGGIVSLISGLVFVVFIGIRPALECRWPGRLRPGHVIGIRLLATLTIPAAIFLGAIQVGTDAVIERLGSSRQAASELNFTGNESAFHKSRGFIWEDTLRMIADNPILGAGVGAYQTAYPIYSSRDRFHIVGQAHNDYLQVLADGGVIAGSLAVLFIWIFFRSLRQAIASADATASSLALGCGGGVFAMLVHSLFDFNLQLISNGLLFIVLATIVWRVAFNARQYPLPGSRTKRSLWQAISGMGSTAGHSRRVSEV